MRLIDSIAKLDLLLLSYCWRCGLSCELIFQKLPTTMLFATKSRRSYANKILQHTINNIATFNIHCCDILVFFTYQRPNCTIHARLLPIKCPGVNRGIFLINFSCFCFIEPTLNIVICMSGRAKIFSAHCPDEGCSHAKASRSNLTSPVWDLTSSSA